MIAFCVNSERTCDYSVKQAQSTYDRRTTTSRKREGLELLGTLASAPKKAATNDASALVVQFQHQPHRVIQTDAKKGRYLLARMVRSSTSNAPMYLVPLNASYEWRRHPISECTALPGEWNNDEFLIQ